MQTFQKHLTTEAFKIAGGIDLTASTTKPLKQHRVPGSFITKITKSFLDSLYAFLDGLVLLASEETEYKKPLVGSDVLPGTLGNRADTIDLANTVGTISSIAELMLLTIA